MEFLSYVHLKILIVSTLPLSKDAIHIYIGFMCLIASIVLLRRPLTSYWVLVLGLIISCAMEILDLRNLYLWSGVVHWRPSLHDLINTNLMPFLLVTLARWQRIKVGSVSA